MNIKDLGEYGKLKREAIQISQSLERLNDSKANLVFDTVTGSGQESPYQKRTIPIRGLSYKYIKTYEKRKKGLGDRLDRCLDKITEIEDFIETVQCPNIRQIIEYRYIQGLEWGAVSRRVYGHASDTTALMALTRYLKARSEKC